MTRSSPALSTESKGEIETLRARWDYLYRTRLPELARAKHDSQPKWPVSLDHCFARIILDNTVGAITSVPSFAETSTVKPWNTVIRAPAIRNMTAAQLSAAISLAEQIETGAAVLTELDSRSLQGRGQASMSSRKGYADKKRPHDGENESPTLTTSSSPPPKKRLTRKGEMADVWAAFRATSTTSASPTKSPSNPTITSTPETPDLAAVHAQIRRAPALTPFRKHVLLLLTQVPRGRFTTYKALAAAAAAHSSKSASSARAVGSAMRNNPFAPTVPCHRVLAADGKIGGFKGEWTGRSGGAKGIAAEEGEFVTEKRALLKSEGVKFDGAGRVIGTPFVDFV